MPRSRVVVLALTLGCLTACGQASTPGTSGGGAESAPHTSAGATAASGAGASGQCPPAHGASSRVIRFAGPPPMCIDPAKSYTATVTTDVGAFTIALDARKAPKTVNNFVFLARNKFYDGIVFHRVIPGFMNQTGDPQGTGAGGPGYEFADELPGQGAYQVGSVAMANSGPDTNGSQFFVVTGADGVGLPPAYSLFGKVTSGMDVVHAIEKDGTPGGQPTTQHTMTQVTIAEK